MIAKLVYKSNNYGLWYANNYSIHGVYKPTFTSLAGGPHCWMGMAGGMGMADWMGGSGWELAWVGKKLDHQDYDVVHLRS